MGQSSDNAVGWYEAAIYIGSFRDSRLNGHGLLIASAIVSPTVRNAYNAPHDLV